MPQYRKPPIIEAVVEITVKPSLSADDLEKLHKRLLEKYPPPVHRVTTTEVEIALGGHEAKVKNSTPGYKMIGRDGADVVVILPERITTSRLAPYEGWDAFAGRGRENWEAWKRLAGWREITRVGVRYINRLDIPSTVGAVIRLENYLEVSPRMPPIPKLPPMRHFSVTAESPLGIDDCKLLLNVGGVPSPLVNTTSFLLDIDIVRDKNLPQNDVDLWALIHRMRHHKNTVFEASITDETRALFSS